MLLETLFECKSEKNSTEVVKELVCAKESKEVSCQNTLTEPLLCMVDEYRLRCPSFCGICVAAVCPSNTWNLCCFRNPLVNTEFRSTFCLTDN